MAEEVDVAQGLIFSMELEKLSNIRVYLSNQTNKPENSVFQTLIQNCNNVCFKTFNRLQTFQTNVLDCISLHGLHFIDADTEKFFIAIDEFISSTNDFRLDLQSSKNVDLLLGSLETALNRLHSSYNSLETISIQSHIPYSTLPKELSNYINVGNEMKESAEIVEIRDELKNLKVSRLPSIYLALVGPSYMGKTQSAFALSHLVNVFYVNLETALSEASPQEIYSPFESVSRIFSSCVGFDIIGIRDEKNGTFQSTKIRQSTLPLQTLGLIYTLLKLKKLKSGSSIEDWYMFYINLANIVFPKLTVIEFNQKIDELGRDFLENSVIFIDELNQKVFDLVQALRNICRAVDLPCILSGTNSKVQNLVGVTNSQSSRDGPHLPWVKVAMRLPKASLKALGHVVKVKSWKENGGQVCLGSFIDEEGRLKIEALINELIDVRILSQDVMKDEGALEQSTKKSRLSLEQNALGELKELVQFTLNQSKSNLPGLAIMSLQFLFDGIVELRSNPPPDFIKALWKIIFASLTKKVRIRKPLLSERDGHLASAHILTFPENELKSKHENGAMAAAKVESNFFYLGECGQESIIELAAGKSNGRESNGKDSVSFTRNDQPWIDKCYFPKLCDDFFAHIIVWNAWWDVSETVLKFSLAAIYEKYLRDSGCFAISSRTKIPDSFALELLAHWSIAYASHFDIHGETKGVDLVREFINNLQRPCTVDVLAEFEFLKFPASLESFLDKVVVPYLVPEHSLASADFVKEVKPFLQLGKSWRPTNSDGFDVLFDLKVNRPYVKDNPPNPIGRIECKLWTKPVGIGTVYTYYKRACNKKSPVTFLVCKELAGTLKKEFGSLVDEECLLEEESSVEKEDDNDSSIPTLAKFKTLWETSPQNMINLYSVASCVVGKAVTFEFHVLAEFKNPRGVFIIVQSNFNPPHRTVQS